jgi:glycerol-3-phosphate O-acyltransferase
MKLNEDNPYINACTAAFSRIVIYPSRSLAAITDEAKLAEEQERSRKINMAAMRALDKIRRKGDILLVFPSGTRYRPGKPETKRGLPEIDSYLRMFDVMLLVSINGNVLRISDNPADMSADVIYRDVLRYSVGPVINCRDFRDNAQHGLEEKDVKKQATADKIMAELEKLHAAEAPNYEKLYSAAKNA